MELPIPANIESIVEKNEPKPKKPKCNNQVDRQFLEESLRQAIIQMKVWFVLSVIASIVLFSFVLWTAARFVPADFNPISVLFTASTGLLETTILFQHRAANKRVDTIRDKLLGVKENAGSHE
jgi:hypothetical protein